MKINDYVKLIADKEEYTHQGVHKGMYGFIKDREDEQGYFPVDLCELPLVDNILNSVTAKIKEEDLGLIKASPDAPYINEYDQVELIIDRPKYNKEGVFKGMQGIVMEGGNNNNLYVVVQFERMYIDEYGKSQPEVIAYIGVEPKDLKVVN